MGEVREPRRAYLTALVLGWSLLVGTSSRPSGAIVLTVDDTCSLADAIEAANADAALGGCPAGSGADQIHLTDEVVLTAADTGGAEGGLPWIASEITLHGFGHAIVRDDGAAADADVLRLGQGALVELHDLSLEIRQPTVGAGLEGASGSRALCADRAAGQRVSIQLDGETSWDCQENGLEVTSGGIVLQKVLAVALASEVGGWATGLTGLDVRCLNDSTGERVRFQPGDPLTSWSCSANGLVVTAGDELRLVVSGIAD